MGIYEDFVDVDRHNVILESAFIDGRGCTAVRFNREGILRFTRHLVVAGNRFSREAHAPVPIGIFFADAGIGYNPPSTKRNGRHGFDAAGDDAIGHPTGHFGTGNGDGLKARCAVTVYGHARNFVGVKPHERDHPSDVQALFGLRRGISNDNVVDAGFIKLREITEKAANYFFAEVVWPHKAEQSPGSFSDCCAVTAYDVCIHDLVD